jgi:hypothetical protein
MLQSLTMGFFDALKATQAMSHIDSQSTADLVAALAPALARLGAEDSERVICAEVFSPKSCGAGCNGALP